MRLFLSALVVCSVALFTSGCAATNPPSGFKIITPLDVDVLSGDQDYPVMVHYFSGGGHPKSVPVALIYRDQIWYVVFGDGPELVWVTDTNQYLIGFAKRDLKYNYLYRFQSILGTPR